MTVLGIETSCDETAASVVVDGTTLLSNVVFSSMDLHVAYGGVVPEIAARSHIESVIPVIEQALAIAFEKEQADWDAAHSPAPFDPWAHIDAIAVTYGAGLGGSLLVGVMTARTLAITKNKPLYAINHVEAHVYANFITRTATPDESSATDSSTANWLLGDVRYTLPASQPTFPMLSLIVSGGHSQLVLFRDHFDYTLLGQTRDDAIGEAFDKVAKVIGLPYPGGPSIGAAALHGDPFAYQLPKAKLDTAYEFSFSGLKTAVLRLAQQEIGKDFTFPSFEIAGKLSELQKHNIAASFQRVAIETVVDKAIAAFQEFQPRSVVIAGGVAASPELRRQLSTRLTDLFASSDYDQSTRVEDVITYTDMKLCTDNGAMIATLGCFRAMLHSPPVDPYTLQIEPNLSM